MSCEINYYFTTYILDARGSKMDQEFKKIGKRIKIIRIEKGITQTNLAKELGIVRKCPHCGASMDINNSGYCKYCRGYSYTDPQPVFL